ncbi:MAG: Na/Pi cotransporter family protein [Parasporobacterium sp.]|nr:Na/Pi cotransporter family protein [Parasporobacterium sp.]
MSITDVISLLSGVALFLFGMSLMGDGLKHVSGNKLEPILFKLSSTPLKGILLGTGVTAVIQSSSATSVMVVGFVNSEMMKIRQAIYVILGAILGTSITGWVVCLSYINGTSGLSSLLSTATLTGIVAVAGIILRMFSKNPMHKHIGDIMMGFAILMFGMSTMSGSVSSLGEQPWFTSLLVSLTNPLLGMLIGLLFCALLQSASAAVGIIQALSVTGAVALSNALPLLMGISIGAAFPVLLSALGAKVNGRRTAFSYLVCNFMGVMVFASIFYILDAVFEFYFMNTVMSPVTIAIVNTIFRLIILLILAPFTDVIEAVVVRLIPDKKKPDTPGLNLEERFINHPALAIEQSRQAISQMSEQAETAVGAAMSLITQFQQAGLDKVYQLEANGDVFEDELGDYLMKLTSRELTDQQSRYASVYLHSLSDLERISDHARNIAENAAEIHDKHLAFSDAALQELSVMEGAINEILQTTMKAFRTEDAELAKHVEPLEEVIDDLSDEMKMRHVDRLQRGQCTIANGFVFNDLITNFERISDHCSNIAVAIIEMHAEHIAGHEYLERVKDKRLPDFERLYESYREKYTIDSGSIGDRT